MNYIGLTLLLVLAISSNSVQQPTFYRNTYKGLNGLTLTPAASDGGDIRVVYYYEQLIAVIDLGINNELHNCNLIEVYEQFESDEILRNLSISLHPQRVSFREMTKLMRQCESLDKLQEVALSTLPPSTLNKGTVVENSLSILYGILPGTKWCGTGDIAENYHDLGLDSQIDRCCRSHDLCPIKIRAHRTRYNLTNNSLYTKSHCTCDEAFYRCLKESKHPTADIMGRIYFNFVKVPCIEELPRSGYSIESEKHFIPVRERY